MRIAHVVLIVANCAWAQDIDEGDIRAVVDVIGVDGVSGYTTYRLALHLQGQAESVYAIFGDVAADGTAYPLQMPAAYQNPAPFGAHIGGVNKHIVKFRSEAKYDAHPTVHR